MMHVFDPLRNSIAIGPIEIYFYSLFILLGVLIALYLGIKEGEKIGIKGDYILDGIIIILPLSILGARLYYVIFEWERYAGDFARIFAFREGGLAIHGAFIVAVISAYVYTRIRKLDFLKVLDLVAPGFLVAQALGRWGNFFNQEAHGYVIGESTNGVPNLDLDTQRAFLEQFGIPDFIVDNMYLQGPSGLAYYHPTFLYESLWNIVGFVIMLVLRRTRLIRSGDMVAVYLIWYSVGRFFIEALRTDSLYFGDSGIRTAQVISIISVLIGAAILVLNRTVFKRPNYADVIVQD